MTAPITRPHRPHKDGERTRETIRAAIVTRRAADQRWPILDEIVEDTGLPKSTVRHQIDWMAEQQQIRIEPARREIVLIERRTSGRAPQESGSGS